MSIGRHNRDRHTGWCARGHRCGLGQHRSQPVSAVIPGAGSIVLTRVQTRTGTQLAEIRLSILLPEREDEARSRLTVLLSHLRVLVGPPRPHQRRRDLR